MKIGVISDSHDQIHEIEKAVDFFNKEKVELVIHCGDWVSPFAAAKFSGLKCPIKGVFGNNDGDKELHRSANKFIEYHDNFLEFEAEGRKIYVTHGHNRKLLDTALESGKYSTVFSGHEHIAHAKMIMGTLWLNPGSLMDETNERIQGKSVAVYDTESNSAKIVPL